MTFALGTYSTDGRAPFPGLIRDRKIWPLRTLGINAPDMLAVLADWERNLSQLCACSLQDKYALSLDALAEHAPIRPAQVFGVGANYRKHVIEIAISHESAQNAALTTAERRTRAARQMDERAATGSPFVFLKAVSALAGPSDEIEICAGTEQLDWECELAVVIGRAARHVGRAEALSYVAGYCVANDLTARDRLNRADLNVGFDWFAAKCGPTYLPLGPAITPATFVGDPQDLNISLRLNGEVKQEENTADMLFDVARQIEYISGLATLLPGDVILTGSPAGNGGYWKRYLQVGDLVESSIAGLGTLTNLCVAGK